MFFYRNSKKKKKTVLIYEMARVVLGSNWIFVCYACDGYTQLKK